MNELSNNPFYVKEGRYYYRRIDPLIMEDFKYILSNLFNFNSNCDITKINLYYNNYLDIFRNNFPSYKKSKNLSSVMGMEKNWTRLKYYTDRGYSKDEGLIKLSIAQNKTSLKSFIERYGEINGKIGYDAYLKKWKDSISKKDKSKLYEGFKLGSDMDLWLQRVNIVTGNLYTKEEIEIMFKEWRSKGFKSVWSEYRNGNRDKSILNTTIEHYLLKGMDQEEAEIALSDRQSTFSLKKLIGKYGVEEGRKKWDERQAKWKFTMDSKSQEEKERILKSKIIKFPRYSLESKKIFETLISLFKDTKIEFFYADKEMLLYNRQEKKPYFYDLSIPKIKVIVEYNGSTFHPNMDILTEKEIENWKEPYSKMNAQSKTDLDTKKLEFARKLGYDVYVIWDTDNIKIKIQELYKIIKNKIDLL